MRVSTVCVLLTPFAAELVRCLFHRRIQHPAVPSIPVPAAPILHLHFPLVKVVKVIETVPWALHGNKHQGCQRWSWRIVNQTTVSRRSAKMYLVEDKYETASRIIDHVEPSSLKRLVTLNDY